MGDRKGTELGRLKEESRGLCPGVSGGGGAVGTDVAEVTRRQIAEDLESHPRVMEAVCV